MIDLYSLINEVDRMTDPTRPNIQLIIGGGKILISGRPHSHIGRYQLQLEDVTLAELKAGMRLLAAHNVAKEVDTIYDYYGKTIPTKAAIKIATPMGMLGKRGMAINLQKGHLTIVCDQYGMEREVQQFRTTLTDAVKAVRLNNSLRKQRYKTKVKYKKKERAFILVGVQS